ncbi:hypothetical protein HN51_041800 [Arachis hypogaea]
MEIPDLCWPYFIFLVKTAVLFESLRRLQLMELTVDCLKFSNSWSYLCHATMIGKAVNSLRKHASKDIRTCTKAYRVWIISNRFLFAMHGF